MTSLILNSNKALQSILYIAEKISVKDFHKIFKILYFADREHLSKYGRPITGDTYFKMPKGPVPTKIYDILKDIKKGQDYIFEESASFAKKLSIEGRCSVVPRKKADLDYLSESDVEELDAAISTYGELSFEALTELSHGPAWTSAKDNRAISIKDILKESGQEEDYIAYVCESLASYI